MKTRMEQLLNLFFLRCHEIIHNKNERVFWNRVGDGDDGGGGGDGDGDHDVMTSSPRCPAYYLRRISI